MEYQQIGVEELFNSAIAYAASDYQKQWQSFVKKYGHEPNDDELSRLDKLADDSACHKSHPYHIDAVYLNFIHDNASWLILKKQLDKKVLRDKYGDYCRSFSHRIENRVVGNNYLLDWYKYTDVVFYKKIKYFYSTVEDYIKIIPARNKRKQESHYKHSIRYVDPLSDLIRSVGPVPYPEKPVMDPIQIKMRSEYYKLKELEDFFHGDRYKSWTSIDGDYILGLCRKGKVAKYTKKKYDSDKWSYLVRDEYTE